MRRAVRIGASLALALVLITCTDQSVTGPRRPGSATLDLRAWSAPAPGTPPVPLDSLEITFRRADQSVALDQRLGFRPDTLAGDSAVIRLSVDLSQSPETFMVFARAYGSGIDWYAFTGSVVITAGATAQPAITGAYVGPGANAARVALLPADTTVVGGTTFPLRATAYDAAGAPITGVPIGYRLSDTTRAHVTYPAPYSATLTAALSLRDSAWVVAETPTHLKDSTRIHLIPQPAQLVKVSGDNQTGVLSAPLTSAFVVRVLDALGGGFKGDSVYWAVTAGAATLSTAGGVTDDTGYAQVTVTPNLLGTLQVQATAQPISGAITQSPVSFSALVDTASVGQPILALGLSAAVAVGVKATISVTTQDTTGVVRIVLQPVTVTLVSSAPAHTAFDSSTITIPVGSSSAQTGVTFDTAGTYTITVSAAGYTGTVATTQATGALVTMVAPTTFSPATVTISAGQYVTWKNADAVSHTTTENSATPLWDSGVLSPGQTYSAFFGTVGTYVYHCVIHGTVMSGTVIVQ